METNKSVSRSILTAEILNCFEKRLETIREKSFLEEYRSRSNVIGKRIEITSNNGSEEADCIGIDEIGRLLVRFDSGEEKALTSGTIRIIE